MIRFAYGGVNYDFSNPKLENKYKYEKAVAYGRSAGNQLYRYSKGVTVKTMVLQWENVPKIEKEQFQAAFAAIGTNDFVYTDHTSAAWNARFLKGEVDFVEKHDEKSSDGTYTVGATTYKTTQRNNGRWDYEIEMEVW